MIKLIATDMDGTWLTDHQTYDRQLFKREFKLMQDKDIKFVVASGNQLANLLSRFPEESHKIYFVAENGALVGKGQQIFHAESLNKKDYAVALTVISKYGCPAIVEGLASAYVRRQDGRDFLQEMHKYFDKIQVVDNFTQISDQILKVNMTTPIAQTLTIINQLRAKYPEVGFVAGSKDSIDMQGKGMNKAVGLKYLSQKLGIKPTEMAAFGDSGNDVDMLKYAKYSFVTATAMKEAKKAAQQIIGSSNESAVQKKIWQLLQKM